LKTVKLAVSQITFSVSQITFSVSQDDVVCHVMPGYNGNFLFL